MKTRKSQMFSGESIPYKVKGQYLLSGIGGGTLLETKSNDFGFLKNKTVWLNSRALNYVNSPISYVQNAAPLYSCI